MRRKTKYVLVVFVLTCLGFIVNQILLFLKIPNTQEPFKVVFKHLIKGTHIQQIHFYKPDAQNNFRCIRSLEEISFTKVNDDYCDCLDGSDEPGTNACENGKFYCTTQVSNFPKSVRSPKVNDGICDCCDGSDEWKNIQLLKSSEYSQKKSNIFHPPCPDLC